MRVTEVYKVVRGKFNGRRFESAIMDRMAAGVEYRINEWSEAPAWLRGAGYHLLAFETLEKAMHFINIGAQSVVCLRIYRAEAKNLIKKPAMLSIYDINHGTELKLCHCGSGLWPSGTVMYEKIKLLEDVTDYGKEESK